MTKVISLSDEAYGNLKSLKNEGDSFSGVINRLTTEARKKSILDSAGKWAGTEEEFKKIKKMVREDRKKFKLREVEF
jgi:predicted CopG family antitoxin